MNSLKDSLFILIKFGSEKNMNSLINEGQLRFGLPRDFNKLVNEKERGDEYEGAEWIENSQLIKIEVNHPKLGKHTFQPIKGKLSRLTQYNYFYLSYSLYAVSTRTFDKNDTHEIDERHLEFGDSAVFITEPYKFLNAITDHLKNEKIEYEMNFVDYLNYSGEGKISINAFNKKIDHTHQMEFRIVIKNVDNKPKIINIGSVKDYCELVSSQSLIDLKWKATKMK